jgi:outer membrane protein assembly factor BamE (lipoprotein component of BamABCDE complex)
MDRFASGLAARSLMARSLMALALAAGLAACTPDIDLHGNNPTSERMALLKPGLTKADVVALLGSPSQTSTFGGDSWYYISNRMETVAVLPPKELDRKVVIVTFSRGGLVQEINKLDLDDGKKVAMDSAATPSSGRELGIFEQLIGNVGRFNAKGNKDGKNSDGG